MSRIGLAASLFFAAGEPFASGDGDLVRYALTQGGLLAVVLVLLWFYRRDSRRIASDKNVKIDVLIAIVQNSTAALTRNAEGAAAVARALENLERRHR
jgi:hypothetical protein